MTTARFAIVMRLISSGDPVYLTPRLTWMFDLEEAATFVTEAAAQRAFDDAARTGKKSHFASAKVEAV